MERKKNRSLINFSELQSKPRYCKTIYGEKKYSNSSRYTSPNFNFKKKTITVNRKLSALRKSDTSLSFKSFKITRTPTEVMVFENIKKHKENKKMRETKKNKSVKRRTSQDLFLSKSNRLKLGKTKSTDFNIFEESDGFFDSLLSYKPIRVTHNSFFRRTGQKGSMKKANKTFINKLIQKKERKSNSSSVNLNGRLLDSIANYQRREANFKRIEKECRSAKKNLRCFGIKKIPLPNLIDQENPKMMKIRNKLVSSKQLNKAGVLDEQISVRIQNGKREGVDFLSQKFELMKARTMKLIRYSKEDKISSKEIKAFHQILIDGEYVKINSRNIEEVNLRGLRKFVFEDSG